MTDREVLEMMRAHGWYVIDDVDDDQRRWIVDRDGRLIHKVHAGTYDRGTSV